MAKQICAVQPILAPLPELERVLRAGGYVAVIEDRRSVLQPAPAVRRGLEAPSKLRGRGDVMQAPASERFV